jgi:hypothetical protein
VMDSGRMYVTDISVGLRLRVKDIRHDV